MSAAEGTRCWISQGPRNHYIARRTGRLVKRGILHGSTGAEYNGDAGDARRGVGIPSTERDSTCSMSSTTSPARWQELHWSEGRGTTVPVSRDGKSIRGSRGPTRSPSSWAPTRTKDGYNTCLAGQPSSDYSFAAASMAEALQRFAPVDPAPTSRTGTNFRTLSRLPSFGSAVIASGAFHNEHCLWSITPCSGTALPRCAGGRSNSSR